MKNPNTNINRPKISSEEINAGKNFDKTFSQYTKVSKPFFKQNWFIANSIVASVAIIVVATLMFSQNNETTGEIDNTVAIENSIATTIQLAENAIQAFVSPPIKGVNVPFSSYMVQSNKGKTITHKTGSFIKVPKNAFVNENGNIIKGKVEIKYREFKDVAEIFASGIPMTYNENGEEFHFESAGMIEILAYQDGKQVFMNPEKKIDIEMTSDYDGTHYNLYSLDTTERNWVYEGKDKVIVKGEENNDINIDEVRDQSLFDDLFSSVGQEKTTPDKNPELKSIKEEIVVIQKDIKKIKKTKPNKPKKATESRFRFNLDVKKEEFPEMSVYEGLEFEIGKENKSFDPELTNKEWHDIALAKNEKGKYILTLKRYFTKKENKDSKMDVKEFIVYPVYEGDNYEVAMKDFDKKFDKYSEKLSARKEDERLKKEEYEKKIAEIKAENKRRQEEWEANASNRQKASKTAGQIYRAFSVMRFGTFNCDSPQNLPRGQTVLASFKDKDGNKLEIQFLYLVEKNRNLYFSYYPNRLNNFKFNPNSKNSLIGVTTDNQVITFSNQEFKEIPRATKKYDFEMKVQPTDIKNTSDLKKCIAYL